MWFLVPVLIQALVLVAHVSQASAAVSVAIESQSIYPPPEYLSLSPSSRRFGFQIDVDGEHMVVGMQTGYYVGFYQRNVTSGTWYHTQTLTGSFLGISVALRGTVACISNGNVGTDIYRFDGTNWNFEKRIPGSYAAAVDVTSPPRWAAISDDGTRVISGYGYYASKTGIIYFHHYQNGVWVQKGGSVAGNGPNNAFGERVSMSGDGSTAMSCAVLATGTSEYCKIFRFSSSANLWQLKQTIYRPSTGLGSTVEDYGSCSAINEDGSRLFVGHRGGTGGGTEGYIHVYTESSANVWTLAQTLVQTLSDPENPPFQAGRFPQQMYYKGQRLLVGALWGNYGGTNCGEVHLYQEDLMINFGTYTYAGLLGATTCVSGDQLGQSIALSSTFAMAGAPFTDLDDGFAEAGRVVVWNSLPPLVTPPPTPAPTQPPSAQNAPRRLGTIGFSVSSWEADGVPLSSVLSSTKSQVTAQAPSSSTVVAMDLSEAFTLGVDATVLGDPVALAAIREGVRAARCGSLACNVQATVARRRLLGRSLASDHIDFTISLTLSEADVATLESGGQGIGSAGFDAAVESAINSALVAAGIDPDDVTIDTAEGVTNPTSQVQITVQVQATNALDADTVISQISTITGLTDAIATELAITSFTAESVDKCTGRTCSDRGTCDPGTGICTCNDSYHGNDCQFVERTCSCTKLTKDKVLQFGSTA